MRPHRGVFIVVCAFMGGVGVAVTVRAQTPPSSTRISLNAGIQPASTTFDSSTSEPVYLETAVVNSSYRVSRAPFFDGGVTVAMRNGLGVGLTVSWFSNRADAAITAAIPHPFLFNSPRGLAATQGGLRRDELAAHFQAVYIVRPIARLDIVVSGGPSLFKATQEFISGVSFSETYPYDSAAFTGAASKQVTNHKTGFNLGADVGIRLGRSAGVGGLVRFSRASVSFASPNETTSVTVDVGGLQIGAGLRLYF